MTVLVTGGAGFIGSHVVLELLGAGREVVVLDDLSTGVAGLVHPKAELIIGDAGDASLVAGVLRTYAVDAIVHLAARTSVPESLVDPLSYYRVNAASSRALIEAAVRADVRSFVYSSTAAVYGQACRAHVSESDRLSPINPYGRSKLMVEWMLEDTARSHSLATVTLRYFNVAGADPQGRAGPSASNAAGLIRTAAQVAVGRRDHLDVFGTDYPTPDGYCVRDFIQVTDLARIHVLALDHLNRGGESLVLNCGYGHGHSVLEVVNALRQVSGVEIPVRLGPRRLGDPASVVANVEKLKSRFGWTPQFDSLDTMIEQALRWERHLISRAEWAGGG